VSIRADLWVTFLADGRLHHDGRPARLALLRRLIHSDGISVDARTSR
jgi:hypothetical protein